MTDAKPDEDLSALAKGGRQNFFGFILRLVARLPFLFIAGRLYGPDALGRFASALVAMDNPDRPCPMPQTPAPTARATKAPSSTARRAAP